MVSKSILAVIAIVAILVIGGGIYMMQQQSAPTTTPTPTTPKPAATTPTETPTIPEEKILTTEEENQIKDAVMNYIDTFNQHSVEEHVACLTDDGVKSVGSMQGIEEYYGHDEIRNQLIDVFQKETDISLENIMIQIQGVREDKVNVHCTYRIICEKSSYNVGVYEDIVLVKIGNTWKIASADITTTDQVPIIR